VTHDDTATIRANLARAHREAAEAADRGDDETYLALVALADVYERRLAIRGHDETPHLHNRTHRATIIDTMDAEKTAKPTAKKKRRSGPPLTTAGPVALASKNSGKSMFEIAAFLGESYDTVKTWNRRASAPERIMVRLAAAPFLVPLDDWK
jgi:hypothetical protein